MPDDQVKGNGTPKPFNPPPRFIPPRSTDEFGRPLPKTEEQRRAQIELWNETVRKLEEITDETDDDEEGWDEILRNLGVDPATGRGLAP
jgi:hypothetical protein